MTTAASEEPARPRGGVVARMLRSRLFVIIAGIVALALIAATVFVYVTRFDPFATVAASEYAPSAFPTSLVATTAPAVSRGGTVTLSLQAFAPDDVVAVEVWDGDELYYRLEDPPVVKTASGPLVDLHIDWVATVAGSHVISARTVTAKGQVSMADPIAVPVLDLEQDLVPLAVHEPLTDSRGQVVRTSAPFPAFVSMTSSLGDTAASIAARLALDPSQLIVNAQTALDAATPIPPGTPVTAPLVDRDTAKQRGFGLTDVSTWTTGLTGSVTDCVVTVSLDELTETMALYSTSPLQPGYVRVGDVGPDAPWTSATMPIGPTMYVAYRTGTTDADTGGANAPTAPLYLSVPSSCADKGWTGDARVVNGALVTDVDIQNPYAYISVDQEEWVRVPSGQGQYLSSGSLNDIRSALSLAQYDQVDLEVWSFDGARSSKAAAGQFCRKNVPNATPAGDASSSTNTECRPAGAAPSGDTRLATTGSLSLAFGNPELDVVSSPISDALSEVVNSVVGDDPHAESAVALTSDQPLVFTATLDSSDADRVIFQYSYFPLQESSTALSPPGVVYMQEVTPSSSPGTTKRTATTTVNLWKWRNARQEGESSTFSAGGDNLQLDDEIALALATERLAAGKSLIDTVYVRAIAADDQYYGSPKPVGIASPNLTVDLRDGTSYPTIANPAVTLTSGLDVVATDGALRHKCFEVLRYPDPNTWDFHPGSGPTTTAAGGEVVPGEQKYSDLAQAENYYPRDVGLQCLDPRSDAENARFAEQRREAESDCTFDCILFSVFLGAVIGFATGGPVGAFVGAGAGAAIALAAPGIANAIFSAAKQYWDLVAATYNAVMGGILFVVSEMNLVCAALDAADQDGAADKCKSVTGTVASATITALTGLPPKLPMSAALVEIAKGNMQAIVVAGMDFVLGKIGISCDTLSVDSSIAVSGIEAAANKAAKGDGKKLVDAAKTPDGGLSLCDAAANLLLGAMKSAYTTGQSSYTRGALEDTIITNTIVEAVSDAPPMVDIAAPAADGVTRGQTCPVTVNATVTKPYLAPNSSSTTPTTYAFDLIPLSGTLTAFGAADEPLTWTGKVAIPILPYQSGLISQLQLRPPTVASDPSAPFLQAFVDSPCFASTYALTATELPTGSGYSAFRVDNRNWMYYLGQP